jgi:hypothetical protein
MDHLERAEDINISYNFHLYFTKALHGRALRLSNTTSYALNFSSAEKGVYVLEILVGDTQVNPPHAEYLSDAIIFAVLVQAWLDLFSSDRGL